jgi:hypothetical protein
VLVVAAAALAVGLVVVPQVVGRDSSAPPVGPQRTPVPAQTRWTVELAQTALAGMNLNNPPAPGYFAGVEEALVAHGVKTLTILRWDGSGDELQANGYLPSLGAGITVRTISGGPGAQPSPNHCVLNGPLVDPPSDRCTTTTVPGGVLVIVDASTTATVTRDPSDGRLKTAATQVVFDSGSAMVSVTTWVMDSPTAKKVPNAHPVDVATLTALAQDPRMRW